MTNVALHAPERGHLHFWVEKPAIILWIYLLFVAMSETIDLILIFTAHGGLEANPSGTDVTFLVGRLFTNQTLELAGSQSCYLWQPSRLVVVEFLPQSHSRIFFFDKYQVCWSHPSQVECREDTRDTCVLEEVVDPRMTRDGTSVSKMWTLCECE